MLLSPLKQLCSEQFRLFRSSKFSLFFYELRIERTCLRVQEDKVQRIGPGIVQRNFATVTNFFCRKSHYRHFLVMKLPSADLINQINQELILWKLIRSRAYCIKLQGLLGKNFPFVSFKIKRKKTSMLQNKLAYWKNHFTTDPLGCITQAPGHCFG